MSTLAPVHLFTDLATSIHADNVVAGWWSDLNTGAPLDRNVGEALMLVVTEISEAHIGFAGGLTDDKLPHLAMLDVELADAAIRLFDLAGSRGMDVTALAQQRLTPSEQRLSPRLFSLTKTLLEIVDKVSDTMEAHRKSRNEAFAAAIATTLLWIFEAAADLRCDLVDVIEQKRAFNRSRADHKPENRRAADGKKC